MKKIISLLNFTLLLGIYSLSAQDLSRAIHTTQTSCCNKNNSELQVKAFYFHATHRCATCEAVESVTRRALKEYYDNKISFSCINKELDKNRYLLQKYNIHGQALILVKGDKKVNLTNYAFMTARTNPMKLKAKIKSTIDSMN
ncbi:nitrophenyl compound nitroreductase subunit ArsF family protein [Prolixibacteraceae bacterium]|nr:nitrophenyl compound nitroreductase subunit ArsF family protein [Prolixibacteraceae bacterium]